MNKGENFILYFLLILGFFIYVQALFYFVELTGNPYLAIVITTLILGISIAFMGMLQIIAWNNYIKNELD